MNRVIDILMKRDGIEYEDARNLVKETKDEIISNPFDANEIIKDYLGLESDYLEDILLI